MSQSSSNLNGSIRRCRCGLAANYFMVWTPLNDGRRFFKCPKHEDEKCSYWEWQDEELPPRISNLICSLKKEKEALIRERNVLQRKVADLENVMMLVDHGGIEFLELERNVLMKKVVDLEYSALRDAKYRKKTWIFFCVILGCFVMFFALGENDM